MPRSLRPARHEVPLECAEFSGGGGWGQTASRLAALSRPGVHANGRDPPNASPSRIRATARVVRATARVVRATARVAPTVWSKTAGEHDDRQRGA